MSGVTTVDRLGAVMKALHALTGKDVLVGIPSERTDRLEKGEPINNATIGYFQEFGAPAANIPARPHLIPGIEDARPDVVERFAKAAQAALQGNVPEVDRQLNAAGLIAQNKVRARVNAGIAPALSESTLKARARRGRKGAIQELKNRNDPNYIPSVELAKPLIDSGQYRNSLTYVIRKK